jgi:hypothetical protein
MKRVIGETYTFQETDYKLIATDMVANKDKRSFLLKMSIAAILFTIIASVLTILLFPSGVEVTFRVIPVILLLIAYIAYIPVHELLHGMIFVIGSKHSWKELKFGLVLSNGLAYCIPLVPETIARVRWSLMMPLYVVCIPLYLYAIISQQFGLAVYAVFLAAGSVGDIVYLWKLRHYKRSQYMMEELPTKHGYEIGFHIYEIE